MAAHTSHLYERDATTPSMAKEKVKGAKGVPNKHLHARVAFLHQAALHLARQQCASNHSLDNGHLYQTAVPQIEETEASSAKKFIPAATVAVQPLGLSQHLSSHLRQVALKAQIRLDSSVKRSVCKTCSAVLIAEKTCLMYTENLSRGGRKPHADMLVLQCMACGTKKRFPTDAERQRKKSERKQTSSIEAEKAVVPPPK